MISTRFFILIFSLVFLSTFRAQASDMIDYPVVKLRALDKVSARTETFEANVGSTVKFGSLFIRVQACRKAPPVEQPESGSFLQIWQLDKEEKPQWVFSGWMFASSPGLSSMDHPIYDVWVMDCLDPKGTIEPQPVPEQPPSASEVQEATQTQEAEKKKPSAPENESVIDFGD